MRAAVIGLGFGDEGKGMVTDYLCSKSINPLVIRFSGGHQAGHTVVRDGKRHVFSNFGSGTLSGAVTYWSQFCTIEPIGLIKELHTLLNIGVKPVLFINEQCPVTTPYDIKHNQLLNEINEHGTCGVGFGATIEREEKFHSILAEDLKFPSVLRMKMNLLRKFYYRQIRKDLSLDHFYECVDELMHYPDINIISGIRNENVVFEGSQGLLLDKNIGLFPHVTRSSTGTANILAFDYNPQIFDLYLVTRTYQTRHGNGLMTNEELRHNILIDEWETNIDNKHQGAFRRTLLDLDLLLYGIHKDLYIRFHKHNSTLVLTCLDHIVSEYRFTHKGKVIYCDNEDDFISKISNILGIKKILISHSPLSSEIKEWKYSNNS